MVSFKVSWHFFYIKKIQNSNDTSENPNSSHLIQFLMGYPNQISPNPIVLLYVTPWCCLHCLATTSSSPKWYQQISGGKPILALALEVLSATTTTASSCLHSHLCLTTSPHLSIQSLKYCSFFSLCSYSPSN